MTTMGVVALYISLPSGGHPEVMQEYYIPIYQVGNQWYRLLYFENFTIAQIGENVGIHHQFFQTCLVKEFLGSCGCTGCFKVELYIKLGT